MADSRIPVSQIALPLEPGAKAAPQRIVVGNANRAAVEALGDPDGWPFGTAILTGPPRAGKSLLGRWAGAQGIAVIDGADRLEETDLFHRWNAIQPGGSQAGGRLLLIADSRPWEIALPDLNSRLGGSLQLEIGDPDDAMAAQLVTAFAEQRGLSLADGAADYLVPRAERSFEALEHLIATVDRISLERQVPATMSVWRAALEALHGPEQQRLF
ncbi:ATPase [Erythrobacter sp. JK5]|uniref:HdaA/DnaA family protein n=1 Tax=Erythrobacter sp. JK5 TaxID=2829500 RepID=UPI001BA8FE92|nr:ATPase [Erythrobacter sp. JK5]QUL38249.1 ATPase [Erythrobacter sp. JK5]